MRKIWLIGVLTLLMVWSNDFLPRLTEAGWCGGGGGGSSSFSESEPPRTPSWGDDYSGALNKAQNSQQLVLMAFCADNETEKYLSTVKINAIPKIPEPVKLTKESVKDKKKNIETPPKTNPPVVRVGNQEKFLTDFIYILIPLSAEYIETAAAARKNKNKPFEAGQPALSDKIRLLLDYNVTSFPQLIFCDWYGNELGRKPLSTLKQMGSITEKARTDMLKEQMKLEESLNQRLETTVKSFEAQKIKQSFTALTIKQLETLAAYKGKTNSYEPVIKAREYLKEIKAGPDNEPRQGLNPGTSSDKSHSTD